MDTPLDKLTEQFRRLPGIGVKTARKLAYYIVQQPNSRVDEFVDAICDAKKNMHFCSVCFNLSSQDPCPICSDISRDRSTICVVETPQDVQAIERSGDHLGDGSRRRRRSYCFISGPPHQDGWHPRDPYCPRASHGRRY